MTRTTSSLFLDKALADIAVRDKFAIVDGPFGTQLHASEYESEGVPVVRVVNTSFSGEFLTDNMVFISENKAKTLLRSKVVPGDVIVAKTGATIGKSCIFPEDYSYGIIASSCMKITVDPSMADCRFVAFLIQSEEGQTKIIDGAGGSTRTTINTKPFGAICFRFPPKSEQAKIAEILSILDRAIEQTEALIAKQQRIKQGMMRDLLTRGIDEHGNLRSEQTHEFKDSPLGRIPEEWELVELQSIAEFVTSGPRSWGRYYSAEGAMFLRIGNLTRNHINLRVDDLVFVNPPHTSEGSRVSVSAGDLLISITADLGIVGVIPEEFGEAYINQHIALVRLWPMKMNSRFCGWFLSSRGGQMQIESMNESGAKAGLNLPTIGRLLLPTTDLAEQEQISQILDSVTDTILDYHSGLAKLRSLKTALMQDLLTGNKRVTPLLETESVQ